MDIKYAACVLVRNFDGLYLSVSRKDDPTKSKLRGGAQEAGETLLQCAARELLEETGLHLKIGIPAYTSLCPSSKGVYEVTTYTGWVGGIISVRESGIVSWVTREALCSPDSPFGDYNRRLFEALEVLDGEPL